MTAARRGEIVAIVSDGSGTLGLMGLLRRVHVFGFGKVQAAGVASRWTRDLAAVGEAEVAAGELVELWSTLEGGEAVTATTKVRFDVLEEDWLFTGGLDDQLVSLAGPGATAPDGFTRLDRRIAVVALGPRETVAEAVATFVGANPADFDEAILVVQDRTPELGRPVTHVVTWWRTAREGELLTDPELYFVLDLDDARVEDGCEMTLDVGAAAPGALVRLSGRLLDVAPFAGDEPLAGVPVRLGGRIAVSGADGRWTLDCRLPPGESPLVVERPGIDRRAFVARLDERADGTVQVTVREDPGPFVLGQVTTGEAPTDEAPVALALPDVRVRVHKLRGVVTWPDSRSGAAAYRGTPLRNRRVYVLPLDDTRPTALQRPYGTAAWAALRHRPDVLRSRPAGRAREDLPTDADGAFEVKFVNLTAGSAHLIWVEGPDPDDANRDSPEYLVRTFRRELRELHDGNAPLQRSRSSTTSTATSGATSSTTRTT